MVVISIKLSDGSVITSRTENGSCSENGRPLKWKPRKVSAIRHFPPGCGPAVQPNNVVDNGSGSLSVTDNHVANDGGSAERVELGVETDKRVELGVENDKRVESGVETDKRVELGVEADKRVELGVESDKRVELGVETDKRVELSVETGKRVELGVDADKRVELGVETGEQVELGVETDRRVESGVETDKQVESGVETDKRLELGAENLVNNELKNGDVQMDNVGSVIIKEKEIIPKLKFTRRRVSAIRDFPPYCGLGAEEPTEEERIRINGRRSRGTDSNGSVKDGFVHKTQSNESTDVSKANQETQMIVKSNVDVEDGKNMKSESSKKVQNIGQACQELVVYTRDKVLKKASPDDDAHDVDYNDDSRDNKPLGVIQKDIMNVNKREGGSKRRVTKRPLDDTDHRVFVGDKIKVVMGLQAPSLCPPRIQEKDLTNKAKGCASITPKVSKKKKQENQEKVIGESSSAGKVADGTLVKVETDLSNKGKRDAATTPKKSVKKKQKNQEKVPYTGTLEMVVKNDEDIVVLKEEDEEEEEEEGSFNLQGTHDFEVSLPPFGPNSSDDARNIVRKTLRFFQTLCRKLLQGVEAKPDDLQNKYKKRVDLAAKVIMEKKGRLLKLGKKTHGPIPGVEVGDEFQYRVELALVGIHRIFQGGIEWVKLGTDLFAVSVVASGGYKNEVDKPDCMKYSGQGGIGKDKSYENQKLERGNLALKNNIDAKYPVRVVRGYKVKSTESSDSKSKLSSTYIYDGLYTVESCEQVTGPHGNMVFQFELKRVPGQPQLAIREVMSKKFKTREGVCVKDISNGKEVFPICAINTIDDEKPPAFTYITKIMYPDWYKPVPPKGCDCSGRCSDKKCSCASKNGGEIPYNHNGAIVEAKPLVYECGPSCRCSRTCYNRVTQRGMKIHLEIFKTESRGWGVRSVSSISSGSFICEYIGELLEDTEAEKRTGNDEYLFDIGQNYSDCSLNPETKPEEIVTKGDGFTIDAKNYGNIGRFINHSCSPNLYAQNVLYDQDDERMPHIMLFAAENIPPLQELTYHYNYTVDAVQDADGNVKVKKCYCGSSECTGRLY